MQAQHVGAKLRFEFDRWSSKVALRKSKEVSLPNLSIDPGNDGAEIMLGDNVVGVD